LSDHLAIPLVAASQNQKEVTLNEAVNLLDRSSNADATIALADANLTLTAAQVRQNALLSFTGTLTAPRVLTLPAGKRQILLRNATAGGHALEVGYATGSRATIPPNASAVIQADGTNCIALGASIEIGFYIPGTLLAGQRLAGFLFTRRIALPAGLAGSRAALEVAPTSAATFSLQRNGSGIASLTFAAGATTASFSLLAEATLEAGDRLTLIAPSPADPSLADLYLTLRGRPV
jgi:hypothetical protein